MVLSLFLVSGGCISPSHKKQIGTDIRQLQLRVNSLETYLQDRDKNFQTQGTQANQRIASTNTRIERLKRDIQLIRGELGTLKVGIITGQLPGAGSQEEGSIAQSIDQIILRLDDLEATQKTLKKIADNKKNPENIHSEAVIITIEELRKAFQQKKYQTVIADGPQRLKKETKKRKKEEVSFLIAESLYKIGNLREAALKFNDYLEMSPAKNIAHTKLRLGDCFRHLGDKKTASVYYEQLISEHPKSNAAKRAAKRLENIQSEVKTTP